MEQNFMNPHNMNRKSFAKQPLKAYEDFTFLNSADARVIRILAEYLEPLQRMKKYNIRDTIVFYGSARISSQKEADDNFHKIMHELSHKVKPTDADKKRLQEAELNMKNAKYYEMARELAYKITQWALALEEKQRFIVVSGGGPGIMEAANRGASEAGGKTIGLNISLPFEQNPNPYISQHLCFEFHYFFMRKFWFLFPCRALIVCPGGFGTFDELFDLLTLRQTKKIAKPACIVLLGAEFWNSVINFERLEEWGMIDSKDLNLFQLVDDVDSAFEFLKSHLSTHFVQEKRYWHW
jgi:uncharacterized protein (TIGR00730 family)